MPNLSFSIWRGTGPRHVSSRAPGGTAHVQRKGPAYPVLQGQDGGFVDVELDCDFGFADTHVAVGAGGVQDTRDEELLPEVGTLVQEDLAGEHSSKQQRGQPQSDGRSKGSASW